MTKRKQRVLMMFLIIPTFWVFVACSSPRPIKIYLPANSLKGEIKNTDNYKSKPIWFITHGGYYAMASRDANTFFLVGIDPDANNRKVKLELNCDGFTMDGSERDVDPQYISVSFQFTIYEPCDYTVVAILYRNDGTSVRISTIYTLR